MLEQAQIAALRRHQEVYDASLQNARLWVETYLDADSENVQGFVATLIELQEVQLMAELPDISGSLTALKKASREGV